MRIRTRRAGPMAVALVLIALVGLACGRGGGGATTAAPRPALTRRVHDATHLTAADRDALTTQLAAETSGLTALKAKIDADTDLATLRADLRDIVTQYRVYLLMDPKVHLVIGADRVLAAADAFDKVFAKLDGKPGIDQAKLAD